MSMNDAAGAAPQAVADPPRTPWRLWHIFAFTAWVAVECTLLRSAPTVAAAVGWLSLVVVAKWFIDASRSYRTIKYVGLGLFIAISGLLLLLAAMQQVRTPSRANMRYAALRGVHNALSAYHKKYGAIPPAITFHNGRPWRSWRTDLGLFVWQVDGLPGEPALRYDFDEAWDGSYNRQFQRSDAAKFYRADHVSEFGRTEVFAVIDEQGRWPAILTEVFEGRTSEGSEAHRLAKRTLIAVALPHQNVYWTEPRDLGPGSLAEGSDFLKGSLPSQLHVLFADGSIESLSLQEVEELAPELFLSTSP